MALERYKTTFGDGGKTCTLYNARFAEVFEELISACVNVDAVVADPPYCSGGDVTTARSKRLNKYFEYVRNRNGVKEFNDSMDQVSYACFIASVFEGCLNVLTPPGYVFIFSDWRQLPVNMITFQISGLTLRGVVPWNKKNSRPNPGVFRNQCEYIVWGTKSGTSDKHAMGYVEKTMKPIHARLHLTEKPVEVIEHCLKILPDSARAVFDPFLGSGSTGEACARLGLSFVGCDQEEDFVRIAEKRLRPLFQKGDKKE